MFRTRKIICAGFCLGLLTWGLQVGLPARQSGVWGLAQAEAGLGGLITDAVVGSFSSAQDPATIEAEYNAMRNNYIQAIILQHEACQEYLALAEGREYRQEVDRVGVMQAYLRDNVIPSQLVTGGVDPQFLQQDLERFSRQKDYLTPTMQGKIQGIADKRRAAHVYSGQANRLLAKLTGTTLITLLDKSKSDEAKIMQAGKFLQIALEAADFMKQSHAYSKQTKKFLEPWEEKVGVEERSKKKLLKEYDLQPDTIDLSTSVQQAPRVKLAVPRNYEEEADEED